MSVASGSIAKFKKDARRIKELEKQAAGVKDIVERALATLQPIRMTEDAAVRDDRARWSLPGRFYNDLADLLGIDT